MEAFEILIQHQSKFLVLDQHILHCIDNVASASLSYTLQFKVADWINKFVLYSSIQICN